MSVSHERLIELIKQEIAACPDAVARADLLREVTFECYKWVKFNVHDVHNGMDSDERATIGEVLDAANNAHHLALMAKHGITA